MSTEQSDPVAAFIEAASVPLNTGHASGTLERAEAIRAAHPDLAFRNIHVAAILGDDAEVRRCLELDRALATAQGGPRAWDPLTHLCFSRYLRLDRARWPSFVRAAEALLEAGANPRTGFYSAEHQPTPEFESVLYGVAGVAHHPELARLLLKHGADPNDAEVTYHAPEGWENEVLRILVQSGKLTGDSLATMLLRKADWHDAEAIQWLLKHGADPNRITRWGRTALHQAIQRYNAAEIVETLLQHDADPNIPLAGRSSLAMAARRGRRDLLELFERRGCSIELRGVDRLIAACARGDSAAVRSIAREEPDSVAQTIREGGKLLAQFAGAGNTTGVRLLVQLGIGVMARDREGDGYFDIAAESTALHVAAWRARHETVKFLIENGAEVEAVDGKGRTPLQLAVRACVDSHWTERRSPQSVAALLAAGATVKGIPYPSGYGEVDALLRQYGAKESRPVQD